MAQTPKGRLVQGLYKPIHRTCAMYFTLVYLFATSVLRVVVSFWYAPQQQFASPSGVISKGIPPYLTPHGQVKEVKNLTTVKESDPKFPPAKASEKMWIAGPEKRHGEHKNHTFNLQNLQSPAGRTRSSDFLSIMAEVAHEKVGGERQQHQDYHSRCLSSFRVDHGSKCFQPEPYWLARLDTANAENPCTGALLNE